MPPAPSSSASIIGKEERRTDNGAKITSARKKAANDSAEREREGYE